MSITKDNTMLILQVQTLSYVRFLLQNTFSPNTKENWEPGDEALEGLHA